MTENSTIAFVNANIPWGGGEKWHFEMATKLYEKGRSIFFIVHPRSKLLEKVRDKDLPYAALPVGNLSFLNPFLIRKMANIFRAHRVHSVILNLPSDVKAAGPAARMAGVKKIIYRRGTALAVNNNFYNRYLFQKVLTHLVTNSQETKTLLLKENARLINKTKIRVIYNGLDFHEFDSRPVKTICTGQDDELVLGNAGRFVEQKGQRFLVQIAKRLKENDVPFRMLLAGEGKLKASIIEMAKREGVEDRMIFTGFISDIKSFMASIDVFLLTSLWEGFGYVILEAMAGEKPVIAFNVSSNPEIIEDGENGYLVPFGDTESFTRRIISLSQDERLREKMGRQARNLVESHFHLAKTVKQIEQLIDEA